MADIVDIVVEKTEEVVTIDVTTNETIVNIISQNGGGAVDSVNGQTGAVVLNADDISDTTTTNKYVTSAEKTAITHSNRTILDQITEAFTTALKTAYDSSVTWITTNGTNLINHLSNTSNPHSTTATQVDALKRDGSNANSNINIGEYSLKAGQFELDQSPTGTAGVAITRWNDTNGITETTLKGGSVVLKNGVDLVARVVNKVTPNATLTKANYPAVRVSGAQGQRLAVAYAQANNDNNSADTIGIVCETIATNQEGFILTVGQLEGINTTGSLQGETWSDGDVIYLSPTTAGALTNVKPTGATGHIVIIGYVEYAHAINGKLYVKIMNGWELDELHNVNISSPSNNQILAYTSSNQNWENKSVSTALGFTPEDVSNKQTDLTASATKYPTINAVNNGLALKENTITSGTTSQYFRGDKTFQTLDKNAVGLGNVDNTSDANKPVSTATQTALNLKSNLTTTPRIITNANSGVSTTGTETVVGTSRIDNLGTSWSIDANMRVIKSGTTSTGTIRIYLNNTPDLTGTPTQLATYSLLTTNLYVPIDRTYEYFSGVLRGGNASTSFISDESTTVNAAELAVTIDLNTAQARYLVFTIARTGTAGDTITSRLYRTILYPSV